MMVFSSSRPPLGVARKQQGYNPRALGYNPRALGYNPRAFNQIGTKPPGRWDNADRGVPQRPRSQNQ